VPDLQLFQRIPPSPGSTGIAIITAVCILCLLPTPAAAEYTTLPEGFIDEPVVADLLEPTAFDWLPDRTMLITTQDGVLFHVDGERRTTALDLSRSLCTKLESGLLGIAVDPDFAENRTIYLYFTLHRVNDTCVNRVSAFTMDTAGALGNERVLIDNIPSPTRTHNAGDLQFDGNGLLYVAVGDGGADLRTGKKQDNNGNARRLGLLNGKILRIETDGSIPQGNPFTGPGTTRCSTAGRTAGEIPPRKKRRKRAQGDDVADSASTCQEIYATGLRNPFRIAFDPDDTADAYGHFRFFINDVGGTQPGKNRPGDAYEEINAGAPGADYGWNEREGPCRVNADDCAADRRFVEPVHAYGHANGCNAITGGAFVPDSSNWPDEYDDAYLYSDYACHTIFALPYASPGAAPQVFAQGIGGWTGAIHLAFGPDGALYYSTFGVDFVNGEVRRIGYRDPSVESPPTTACQSRALPTACGSMGGNPVPRAFRSTGPPPTADS
jgi:glucose/arabinose dehydrogenase